MMKIIFRWILVGCFYMLCRASSCTNCIEATYTFNMQQTFSPEKEKIMLGDTLWVNSTHSTNFKDEVSGQTIDFGNSDLATNISILEFPAHSTDAKGAINAFALLIKQGREGSGAYPPDQNKSFYFEENNSEYRLQIGFVAKQKGVFAISVGNSAGTINDKHNCTRANMNILNANTNNNISLYENWRPNYIVSDYEKTHLYCVSVY